MSAPSARLHTGRVLVVEGKYDAARLAGITDAMILPTGGFAIFSDKKRQRLLKELAVKNGLILLTDSDRAGFQIRTYVTNLVGAQHVVQAYVPAMPGKERRKAAPGKEGLLGVEGVPDEVILRALREALGPELGPGAGAAPRGRAVTYGDLYDWGLSGTAGACCGPDDSKMAVMAADSSRMAAAAPSAFSLPYRLRCRDRRRAWSYS